ncbi:hypothetical protein NPIL_178681 [Nephila pilipes]|uniref:Uncharacterized protein n=1 Tax=Nephila pilipes TaxID=299642 RepID=A0A8X6N4M8_NEPPI|nr:hypothetical protein NPIL_178681 [Nephila pilipes]
MERCSRGKKNPINKSIYSKLFDKLILVMIPLSYQHPNQTYSIFKIFSFRQVFLANSHPTLTLGCLGLKGAQSVTSLRLEDFNFRSPDMFGVRGEHSRKRSPLQHGYCVSLHSLLYTQAPGPRRMCSSFIILRECIASISCL